MTDPFEARLRDALRQHAADVPAGSSLLVPVRRAARRRSLLVGAASLAAVLAAALAVPMLTWQSGPAPEPIAAPPVAVVVAQFPLTPMPEGDGFGPAFIGLNSGQPFLRQTVPDGTTMTVDVIASGSPSGTPVPVRGGTGYFRSEALVWSSGGIWFDLRAHPPLPAERLAAYAKTLTPSPMTGSAPFTFASVPPGYAVDNIEQSAVTFRPPDVPVSPSFDGKLTVMLGTGADLLLPSGRPVTVGGRPGHLDGTSLRVDLGSDRVLTVQSLVTPRYALSTADLLTFAAGITVGPSAIPAQG